MRQAPNKGFFYVDSSSMPVYWVASFVAYQTDTSRKIRSFATLPAGWDYGTGGPIDQRTIETAINWEQFLRSWGFYETDAAPSGEGGISVAASAGVHYIELGIEPDHTVTVVHEKERQRQLYLPHLTQDEAHDKLLEIVGNVWIASVYSIGGNTFPNLTGGQNTLSVTPRTTTPSQFSLWTASELVKNRFVNT